MKTLKSIILSLFLLIAINSSAQIGLSNGKVFEFKNGEKEWSEPIRVNLESTKDNNTIPISIRVKFKKRVLFACHYNIEFTNLSEDHSVSFKTGTGYTDASGKTVVKKIKLGAKKTDDATLIHAEGLKRPKSAEDCISGDCAPTINIYDAKIK